MLSIAEIFRTLDYGPAPEDTASAEDWLRRHDRRFGHYIDGAWHAGVRRFETVDPARNQALAQVAHGSADDVAAAVASARAALPTWRAQSGHARARWLYAIACHVQKHARMFAVLESLDNGKPIRESQDIDVALVARHFHHHAGWAQLADTEFAGYEPVGVVGQIIPWNFPLLMLASKIAPALAAGNTLVLKPAEYTPLTALRFAELCMEVGLPRGVVNIVTGDGDTGAALVAHPDVDKIAFTGSVDVGRTIRTTTAGTGRMLSLVLGGKASFLVFDDADLDSAVEGVVDAIRFNQGAVCCAGSRILVQESVSDRFVMKLRARMETLRVGDPLDSNTDIGAIAAPVQLQRIERLVQQGIEDGVTLWQPSSHTPPDGCFYPPTLFTDVAPAATIAQVEIFGPVVVHMTFRTADEAVELANNTRYGLAASVWTENVNRALDIAPRIRAGTVWINCTNRFDAASGFGGYRESGFGHEGGREGMYEYLRTRRERSTRTAGPAVAAAPAKEPIVTAAHSALPPIDRTPRLYIGGRHARPDGGATMPVHGVDGSLIGNVARGNHKDVLNAVEAARAARDWTGTTAHHRAQVLYYIAANLAARADEFADRLRSCAAQPADADREVECAIERLFTAAAYADKFDGAIHSAPVRNVTLAMPEAIGVLAIVCTDDAPLLGLISAVAPAIAMGNRVVVVPSVSAPLSATDFYQVLDTSDVPGGVVNLLTGERSGLSAVLAAHDDVDGLWYFPADGGAADVERLAAGNMKRTWCAYHMQRDWYAAGQGSGHEFLRHATQVKNIWIPYGE